jgi:hypothetical protein
MIPMEFLHIEKNQQQKGKETKANLECIIPIKLLIFKENNGTPIQNISTKECD